MSQLNDVRSPDHLRTVSRRRLLTIGVSIAGLVMVAACGGDDDASTQAPTAAGDAQAATGAGSVQLVDVARGLELAADPSVVVLDVRTPAEFAEGHLDRAQLIDFNAGGFAEAVGSLDRSATYFVYCRSGNRSGQATEIMADLGFTSVYDLDGGIQAWEAAGGPVTIG